MPDYDCYESAARQVILSGNPYRANGYIYPPLLAEGLATVYTVRYARGPTVGVRLTREQGWNAVFYLWQCSQFFLALAGYMLSVRFALALGARGAGALALVAAVFVFNAPTGADVQVQSGGSLDAGRCALCTGIRRKVARAVRCPACPWLVHQAIPARDRGAVGRGKTMAYSRGFRGGVGGDLLRRVRLCAPMTRGAHFVGLAGRIPREARFEITACMA